MQKPATSAAEFIPSTHSLPTLRRAVQDCRGCGLYLRATQAVFGEGAKRSRIVFIGEQPGSEEDLQGRPFVGPAGRLLDKALAEAGIDRAETYVTNAVKHFKHEERGKRRLHKRPSAGEVKACKPWLEAELDAIRPEILVCLGASAAQSVFGSGYHVTQQRGKFIESPWAAHSTSTIHPSAILRARGHELRQEEYERLVADLRLVKQMLDSMSK